ncbi:phosphatase PAP2 family protein [Lactiplantibacillus modestisalitolerans]|uniref:Phosphatase PAP2 family protein n=1 Tax=Lactiplantibacillus modestisalitolerans TaxID=1457219 RepID=A0ABV5WQZ4_9LACO|nr:phosphatase PAP2 family protein [Lactiplantibacillus modestisalitolerans]
MQKKSKKTKKYVIITEILFLIFIFFTVMVKTIDVQPIGPEQSKIGLATLNQFIFNSFGVNLLWYDITDWLSIVAMVIALGFAILGLIQLIQRKSIWKIDPRILLLGVFYFIVVVFYIFFEFVIINYRPIILSQSLEASFPSSHTMIVICIMVTAMSQFHYYLQDKKVCLLIAEIVSVLIIVVTVVGRLISGVHWFTDIVAGALLSSALVALYYAALKYIEEKKV